MLCGGVGAPIVLNSGALSTVYTVCNGQTHSFQLTLNNDSVTLVTDGTLREQLPFTPSTTVGSSVYQLPTSAAIYVGGLKGKKD